jgi:hypothetical protein
MLHAMWLGEITIRHRQQAQSATACSMVALFCSGGIVDLAQACSRVEDVGRIGTLEAVDEIIPEPSNAFKFLFFIRIQQAELDQGAGGRHQCVPVIAGCPHCRIAKTAFESNPFGEKKTDRFVKIRFIWIWDLKLLQMASLSSIANCSSLMKLLRGLPSFIFLGNAAASSNVRTSLVSARRAAGPA